MKVTEMQLYPAINEFIEREIVPLGATMNIPEQFVFGVKIGVIKRKIQDVVKNYVKSAKMQILGLVDDSGAIDIDTIYEAALDAMQPIKQLDIAGLSFKDTDLQKLYGMLQKYAS
jgi:hypothetical protein